MSLPILKLSKPLRVKRRRPSQRITRAEIVAPASSPEDIEPVKAEAGGTPEKTATVSQIYKCLLEKYPAMKDCKPLVAGSHKQAIKERDDLWGYHKTRQAVSRLCKSDEYLKALAADGSRRYHLDGADAGAVSDEHRQHAQQLLDQRANKNAPMVSRGVDESGQDSVSTKPTKGGSIDD